MPILARLSVRIAALVLVAGFVSALLVRYSPGATVDERELDPRLSAESVAALRAERAGLGYSRSRNAPIAELIRERAPATLRELAIGLPAAWLLALGMAIAVSRVRGAWGLDALSAAMAGLLLSVPVALLAWLGLVAGAKAETVLALAIAPRVFRFFRNLLVQAYGSAHVDMARARGVGEWQILHAHVLASAAPQLLALAAASVSMAIGAAIPIEVICDAAGLGRLAWQAAMARDLPLLVSLTMMIALVNTVAMTVAEAVTPSEVAKL